MSAEPEKPWAGRGTPWGAPLVLAALSVVGVLCSVAAVLVAWWLR